MNRHEFKAGDRVAFIGTDNKVVLGLVHKIGKRIGKIPGNIFVCRDERALETWCKTPEELTLMVTAMFVCEKCSKC